MQHLNIAGNIIYHWSSTRFEYQITLNGNTQFFSVSNMKLGGSCVYVIDVQHPNNNFPQGDQ